MLTAIIITDSEFRDSLVSAMNGAKQNNSTEDILFYQKNNYIVAFSESLSMEMMFEEVIREYQPEKIFIAKTARSIDTEHEIGDIILPNILFSFDEKIIHTEITKENRDALIGDAQFLEIFEEHKDYFVEDFGLSIGGIIVENTPHNPDLNGKLMTVYEANAYCEENLSDVFHVIKKDLIPVIFVVGIIHGKNHTRSPKTPQNQIADNLITTIRLLNDEQ